MRLSERSILASLAFFLLAFSVIAQTRIFETKGTVLSPSSWQAEVGLFLPFVLFALISTYHYLQWANKHRKQAVIMMLFILSATSLIGTSALNVPRQAVNTVTVGQVTTGQQGQGPPIPVLQPTSSLQESLAKLQQIFNNTSYFSTSFSAVLLLASAIAVVIVLLRMRPRVKRDQVKPFVQPHLSEIYARTPRELVIQCYRYASSALQSSEFRIPDSDTPIDAYTRIRQLKPAIAGTYWQLTLLFEEARFSLHSISDDQAHSAYSCCEVINQFAGQIAQ